MIFNTLTFVSMRFTQLLLYNLHLRKQNYTRQNFKHIYFYGSLGFSYVIRKSRDLKAEKETILEQADKFFQKHQYDQCQEILNTYEDSTDVEIKWRICRVLYNISKEVTKDPDEKKKLIFEAYDIIAEQLQTHKDHYAVHKWYALLLDEKSSYISIKERIRQLQNVKKHMDLAVTLNPNDATTLHMLGEWCYQVTEMPWYQRKIAHTLFADVPTSNYEDALEYFLKAEAVQPKFYCVNLLRIGMCYLKLKIYDQAKNYLIMTATYPAKNNEDQCARMKAVKLLKKNKF